MARTLNRRKVLRNQRNSQTVFPRVSQRSRRLAQFITQVPMAHQSLIPQHSYRHNLGPCNVICQSCHSLHWIQERSYQSTTENPVFFTCCQRGQIILSSFQDAPEPLKSLLILEHTDGKYCFCHNTFLMIIISCKTISI
jgi:hypothetical protein